MADVNGTDTGAAPSPTPAPAATPAPTPAPTGGMMVDEIAPFGNDPHQNDRQQDLILSTLFGPDAAASAQPQSAGQGSAPAQGQSSDGGSGQGGGSSVPPPAQTPSPVAQGSGGAPQVEQPAFPAAGTQPQQPAGGVGTSPTAPAVPGAGPTPQAGQPQTGVDLMLQLQLQQQNATILALQTQVQQLLSQRPQGASAPGQPGTGQPQGQQPADPMQATIQLQVPQDVMAAIDSEDPATRSNGLAHLVSAVATVTYQRTMQAITGVLDNRFADFDGRLSARSSHEQIERDYYAAFPQHQNELFKQIIAAEAQALWTANPALQWSTEARNALGQRVNAKLLALGINTAAMPAQPNPAPQPGFGAQPSVPAEAGPVAGPGGAPTSQGTERPAAMMGASTRPPASDGGGNFIRQTLG